MTELVPASDAGAAAVELYWIPLGAGTPVVQLSGWIYEGVAARRQGRGRCDLYHAALTLTLPDSSFVVEQAPVPKGDPAARGVVASGPVFFPWAARFRLLRYEVRCWRDGLIPDIDAAVDSPVTLSSDSRVAARVMSVLPTVPPMVWGRDRARAGDMWNSNSVVAWTLETSGVDHSRVVPPPDGRAPGWRAGLEVARRDAAGVESAMGRSSGSVGTGTGSAAVTPSLWRRSRTAFRRPSGSGSPRCPR